MLQECGKEIIQIKQGNTDITEWYCTFLSFVREYQYWKGQKENWNKAVKLNKEQICNKKPQTHSKTLGDPFCDGGFQL